MVSINSKTSQRNTKKKKIANYYLHFCSCVSNILFLNRYTYIIKLYINYM